MRSTSPHACPCQPCDVGSAVVIPTHAALSKRCSSKLCGPDQERIFQQSAFPEIQKQCCRMLINTASNRRQFGRNVSVIVPVVSPLLRTAPDLNETCTTFDESPREQAAASEVLSVRLIESVSGVRDFDSL